MGKRYLEIISGLGMGGAERVFLNRIACMPKNIETKIIDTIPKHSVWNLPSEIPYIACARRSLNFAKKLRDEIDSFNPDSIIVRTPIDLVFVAFLKSLYSKTWKLIFEAHSVKISSKCLYSLILTPALRIAMLQTDLVIAVSNSVAKGAQCKGAKRKVVHHFGANVKNVSDKRTGFQFLFIGRLVEVKQPLLFLEAINQVRKDLRKWGAKVIFVGKGPMEEKIKNFISSCNLESIVTVAGYRDELSPLYAESEFLVSSSRFEGLPVTFFEAKQHGLRIIATPSSGDFDILGDEDIILKDFACSTLAESIVSVLRNGPLTKTERQSIQETNKWMNSQDCSLKYYKILEG